MAHISNFRPNFCLPLLAAALPPNPCALLSLQPDIVSIYCELETSLVSFAFAQDVVACATAACPTRKFRWSGNHIGFIKFRSML